jgi:hypothetical protein
VKIRPANASLRDSKKSHQKREFLLFLYNGFLACSFRAVTQPDVRYCKKKKLGAVANFLLATAMLVKFFLERCCKKTQFGAVANVFLATGFCFSLLLSFSLRFPLKNYTMYESQASSE